MEAPRVGCFFLPDATNVVQQRPRVRVRDMTGEKDAAAVEAANVACRSHAQRGGGRSASLRRPQEQALSYTRTQYTRAPPQRSNMRFALSNQPQQSLRPLGSAASGCERLVSSATSVSGSNAPAIAPAPLHNFANTCYMNAMLQCLLHSPELLGLLEQACEKQRQPQPPLIFALLRIGAPSGSCEHLRLIKEEVGKHNAEFIEDGQSDAHEFLRTFLFVLHSEINIGKGHNTPYEPIKDIENEEEEKALLRWKKHFLRVDNSVIYELFGGIMRTKCVCSCCGKVSLSFDPFLDLSLPMMHDAKAIDIDYLLQASFDDVKEELRGGNQLQCGRCKRLQNGTRSVKIATWPKLLVLHIKRFDSRRRKITGSVVYPEFFTTPGDNPLRYKIYGVVCHDGLENYGHYTSFVRMPTGCWFFCDDARVTATSAREAMSALKQVYVLFYSQEVKS